MKEVSGRKVELDEVIVTPSEPESSAVREDVPVVPAPTGEEVNESAHKASDQVAIEPRGRQGYVLLLSGTVILS